MKKTILIAAALLIASPTTAEAITHAAEQGNVVAENKLGEAYFLGHGVSQNFVMASFWFKKAAVEGYPSAEDNLGRTYFYGQGIAKNYIHPEPKGTDDVIAAYWFRKAADQGNIRGEEDMAKFYMNGLGGVLQNSAAAVHLYRKAVDQGSRIALWEMGNAFYKQRKFGVADYWYRKAAKLKSCFTSDAADLSLGRAYNYGQGVPQNYVAADRWYRKAANQKSGFFPIAEYDLGRAYDRGQGVPKNRAKALYWWKKAAEYGNALAADHLPMKDTQLDAIKLTTLKESLLMRQNRFMVEYERWSGR